MLRLFKAFWYLITFRLGKAADSLSSNPGVMSANYDDIIKQKKERIQQYMDAITGMLTEEERKKDRLKTLTTEISQLEKLKAGAIAKAKQIAAKHADNLDAAKADAEYVKCQAAFRDFSSTLVEKNNSVEELEADVGGYEKRISAHKVNIQSEMRGLDKLKSEKHDAIADVISATEEKKISDMVNGISQDKTDGELQKLRDLRNKAKSSARVSRELAGLDAKAAEDEFLEFSTTSESDNEFDQLIGITKKEVGISTNVPVLVPEN